MHPSCYWGIPNLLPLSAKQISLMAFYVWDIYQKNQQGTRLDKRHTWSQSKHNQWKSKCIRHQGSCGCSEPFSRGFRRWSPLRKFLGSNKHLDWLKADLSVAKTSNVQDYKHTKNWSEWKYTSVKAKSQASI